MSGAFLIPFRFPVPKERQDKRLLQERPAIVARALRTYAGLVSTNYQFSGGAVKGLMLQKGQQVVDYHAVMGEFVTTDCVFCPGEYTLTSELQARFNEFCTQRHLPGMSDSTQFSKMFHKLCGDVVALKKKRVGGEARNGYTGVKLNG